MQADLGLHYLHIPKDMFLHIAACIMVLENIISNDNTELFINQPERQKSYFNLNFFSVVGNGPQNFLKRSIDNFNRPAFFVTIFTSVIPEF